MARTSDPKLVELLASISARMMQDPDAGEVLDGVVDACRLATDSQLLILTSIEMGFRNPQELCRSPKGFLDPAWKYCPPKFLQSRILDTISGEVDSADVVEIYDLTTDERIIINPVAADHIGVRRMIAQALRVEGKLRGCLSMFSSSPDTYEEHDRMLLKIFADYSSRILERHERKERIDLVMHNVRGPISALHSDADFLARRFQDYPIDRVKAKLNDIVLCSELLSIQVTELERALRHSPLNTVREWTVVFRDIVFKAVHQIANLAGKKGLDPHRIQYFPSDGGKVVLYLDAAKLKEVVLMLLMNSIKSSEDDPASFHLEIELKENPQEFIVCFKDWGTGVQVDDGNEMAPSFKGGTCAGVGLPTAQLLMREIGGDLVVKTAFMPTEYNLILPKSLRTPE